MALYLGNMSFRSIWTIGLLAFATTFSSVGYAQTATVDRLSDFTDGLGINSHMTVRNGGTDYPFTTNAEGQPVFDPQHFAKFENAVRYLDMKTLRDLPDAYPELVNFAPGPNGTELSIYQKLHEDLGLGFVFPTTGEGTSFAFLEQNADAIKYIEGPNEVDSGWFIFIEPNGTRLSGIPAAELEQPIIFDTIKSALPNIPVIQYSVGHTINFPEAGDVTANFADFGNAHIYFPTGNQPGDGIVSYMMGLSEGMTPNKPVFVTETGDPTMSGDPNSVSPEVQAQYELTMLFDNWNGGARHILLYEISDHMTDPNNTSREFHFGVFNSDWTPKPAAVAIHNMMEILADTTPSTTTPPPVLTYSLQVNETPVKTPLAHPRTTDGTAYYYQKPNVQSHLFVKNDGTYVLALWNDVRLSDSVQQIDVSVPNTTTIVDLNLPASQIQIYDPLVGTSPIETEQYILGMGISVPTHPIFLFISLPLSCGSHANGSNYSLQTSQTTGSQTPSTAQCPFGGTQPTQTTVSQAYKCTNGVQAATGVPTPTTIAVGSPTCTAALSCGTHASGSTYTLQTSQTTGSQTASTAQCPFGGTQPTQTTVSQDYNCTNGVQAATGVPTPTTIAVGSPTCTAALSCGTHASGSTYTLQTSQTTGSQTASTAQCPFGATEATQTVISQTFSCLNGTQKALGSPIATTEVTGSPVCDVAPPVDTPIVTLPLTLSVAPGATASVTGIKVTDPWGQALTSAPMILNITAGNGLVSTATHSTPAKTIQITGSLAQLNAALASLKYIAPNQPGTTDHLGINPWNQAGHSVQSYTVVTVTGTPTPIDTPTVKFQTTLSLAHGATVLVTGVSIADPWAQSMTTEPMILNITAGVGQVSTAAHPTPAKAIQVSGSLATLNATLASLKYTALVQSGITDYLGINPWNQAGHSVQVYTVVTTH